MSEPRPSGPEDEQRELPIAQAPKRKLRKEAVTEIDDWRGHLDP